MAEQTERLRDTAFCPHNLELSKVTHTYPPSSWRSEPPRMEIQTPKMTRIERAVLSLNQTGGPSSQAIFGKLFCNRADSYRRESQLCQQMRCTSGDRCWAMARLTLL